MAVLLEAADDASGVAASEARAATAVAKEAPLQLSVLLLKTLYTTASVSLRTLASECGFLIFSVDLDCMERYERL